jgi:hypothetical protein
MRLHTAGTLEGCPLEAVGVYSRGTRGVLGGYSRGTRGVLEGDVWSVSVEYYAIETTPNLNRKVPNCCTEGYSGGVLGGYLVELSGTLRWS